MFLCHEIKGPYEIKDVLSVQAPMDLYSLVVLLRKKLLKDSACFYEYAYSSEESKNLTFKFLPNKPARKILKPTALKRKVMM